MSVVVSEAQFSFDGHSPTESWRNEGHPSITAWCWVCACRTIPSDAGYCMFCSTCLTGEARRKPKAPSVEARIMAELEHAAEPLCAIGLGELLPDVPLTELRSWLYELKKRGRVVPAGESAMSGMPRTLWRAA